MNDFFGAEPAMEFLNDLPSNPMLFGGSDNFVSDLDVEQILNSTSFDDTGDILESLHKQVEDEEYHNNFFANDNIDLFSDHDYTSPLSPSGSHSTGGSSSPTNTISSASDYGLDILTQASQEIFDFSPAPEPIPQQVPKTQLVSVRPSYRPLSQPMRKPITSHATQRQNPTFRFKPATQRISTNPANISLNSPSSSVSSHDSGSYRPIEISHGERRSKTYPKLLLNEEEKRLCNKEGIRLPESYPLTKEEERNLKKIRRKIRNKKSAQTSRKRKQDYIEQLEDRVSDCTQENQELKAKLEALSRQNQSVMQQLRKLQSVLAQTTRRGTQAGTCLAVLILSMCLLVAPHLNPFIKQRGETLESEEAAMALSRNTHNLSVNEIAKRSATSRSRTLVEFAEVGDKQCPMVPSKPAVADMPSLEMIPAARRRAMPTHYVHERVVHGYNQHNVKEPIKYAYYEPLVSNPPPRQINLSQHRVEYRVPSHHQQQRYYVQQEPMAKRVKIEPL